MNYWFYFVFFSVCILNCANSEDLQTTKVFVIPIKSTLFNWFNQTSSYWYRASLINAPDLPHWINYVFSNKYQHGFLYGVPPPNVDSVQLEIVGLNRDTYETKKIIIQINVTEKPDPAKYTMVLKIDNLNIDDIFDQNRLNSLLDIFRDELWPESASDLHMTFLTSALKVGARLPLKPNEGEGIVVHLGSTSKFSTTLINLQEEVRPLWKKTYCPRDFRRSTVDRHFRPNNFLVDWCAFRLKKIEDGVTDNAQYHEPARVSDKEGWNLVRKESLPKRAFAKELLTVIIVPVVSLAVFIFLLSFVLCFHHDKLADPLSNKFFNSIFFIFEECFSEKETVDDDVTLMQYEAVQRATTSLRSGIKSETSPQMNSERIENFRPSPPPYSSATKRLNFNS